MWKTDGRHNLRGKLQEHKTDSSRKAKAHIKREMDRDE